MKLLIYTHAFAPRVGGVETFVMLLARGLSDSHGGSAAPQMEVTLLTPTPADSFDDRALSFRIIRHPRWGTLWRCIGQADVVQLVGPVLLPAFLALLRRKPIVMEHHGYQAVCPNGLLFYEPNRTACPGHFMARRYAYCLRCNATSLGWLRSLLLFLKTFPRRWFCKLASRNLPISSHLQARLELPHSDVIYYGIADVQTGAPLRAPAGRASSLCFAYVGRLVEEKGLHLLLQAAAELKQERHAFQLRFVGDGPTRTS
ncbi:MAG: glycosyltransferase, partial [Candidatus Methylomirabilis sp.]